MLTYLLYPSSPSSFAAKALWPRSMAIISFHMLIHSPTHCSLVSVSTVLLKLLLSKLPTFSLFLLLIDTFLFFSYFSCQEHLEWSSPLALERPTLLDFFLFFHHSFSDVFVIFFSSYYPLKFAIPQSLFSAFSAHSDTFSLARQNFWYSQKRSFLHCLKNYCLCL